MLDSEQTNVASIRLPGRVSDAPIAGRYHLRHRLYADSFSQAYYAFDETRQRPVVLRILREDLLDAEALGGTLRRLEKMTGVRGAFLSCVVDVGQDGVGYLAEDVAEGVSLREVLDERRRTDNALLSATELLPTVSHISAGLAAIPAPHCHGDVRPSQIWITEQALCLSGGFVMAAFPPAIVQRVIGQDATFRRRRAPECTRGSITDAGDRYAVAVTAHECMTGVVPVAGVDLDPDLGRIGDVLAAYLSIDPQSRPATIGTVDRSTGSGRGATGTGTGR